MAHLCDIGFFPICSSHFDRLIQKCVRMPANNQINTTDRFRQTQIIYPARFLGEAEMTQADDIVAMMMKPEAVDCSPGYPDRVQRVDLLLYSVFNLTVQINSNTKHSYIESGILPDNLIFDQGI